MAYEYECEEVIKNVIKELIYFKKGKNELAEKEIDEIYAKAKAFDHIVEIYSDNDLYTDEDVLQVIADELDDLERADDER
ncbi:hypothetical protein OWI77_12550 [Staphylococcus nepalensis]|uniref:hypothetical protein n=1 Tax=Staphylococcus nepalensis TaxID=214473 RepID=UPI00226F1FCE|nr:hypothetical protein [Staphylococcus nepalensis]MCY1039630.1 hypothetical protein [Staphylococcus nepalensis]